MADNGHSGPQAGGGHAAAGLLGPGWLSRRAPLGRRFLALCLDWAACWGVALAFGGRSAWWPLVVFAVENVVFIGSLGFTLGHRIAGLTVVALDGGRAGLVRALIRTALLVLVIPAVVWDTDGRGLHDKAAGTAIVRIRAS